MSGVTSQLLCVALSLRLPLAASFVPGYASLNIVQPGEPQRPGRGAPQMPWNVRRGRGGPLVRKGLLCMGRGSPFQSLFSSLFMGDEVQYMATDSLKDILMPDSCWGSTRKERKYLEIGRQAASASPHPAHVWATPNLGSSPGSG